MGTTKKPTRKPSIKQQKALDNVVANGGNVTKAMRDAGYSENTINTPQKLTESRAWKDIMGEYLPDELLVSIHEKLLTKEEVIVRNNMSNGEIEVIPTGQIDVQAVKAALDMAYKLKGSYAAEKAVVALIIPEEKRTHARNVIKRFIT